MPPPTVALLPPAQDLLYAHHGNGRSPGARIALQDAASGDANAMAACSGAAASGSTHVFNNPWPSYRFASISDAMLAYQRGAAIATPQLPEPVPSRTAKRDARREGSSSPPLTKLPTSVSPPPLVPDASERRESQSSHDSVSSLGAASTPQDQPLLPRARPPRVDAELVDAPPRLASWLKPDEPEDAAEEDDEASLADEDEHDNDTWAFQHPPGQPVKGYVRPSFSRILTLDEEDDWREPPVRVERPQWSRGGTKPLVTWLGHAGALVQIPWTNRPAEVSPRDEPYAGVIFDPIFSYRCSPSQLVGPARHLDPPCAVSELPAIHACCISHDHYDHLDYGTILDLWEYHRTTIHFFVPLGLAQWFYACGIPAARVTELDWWHEAVMTIHHPQGDEGEDAEYGRDGGYGSGYPPEVPARIDPRAALTLKLAFTPAQHRSGRGVFDHMTTLWGSWCVGVVAPGREAAALRPGMSPANGWSSDPDAPGAFKVFFGGDTGYRYATAAEKGDDSAVCPAFAEISARYAPFTLAMLPLSTGSSLPFLRSLLSLSLDQYTLTSSLHCSPADSVDIHLILKARRSLGVHWGTFCDAPEARATRVEFGRARRDRGVSNDWDERGDRGAFVVADIGLVMEVL